ncbi:MAG: glycine--tRNA ligase [Omnitrophica WOR_2 bacterium GWA2_47_8]|nr:MAG: glycine--tRNA ligase [Omnitrophica WOR_2 bacterium GWA2_47_8]
MQTSVDMEKITALCKRRGFIFQSSEIYGGLASAWDYGPLGVELKRNVKNAWWRSVVHERDDVVGLDTSILMHPMVWKASGHADNFSDPFLKCPACGKHFRQDKVWDEIWESPWFQSLTKVMKGAKDTTYLIRWAQNEGKKLAPNLALVKDHVVTLSWLVDLHTTFGGVNLDFKNFAGRMAADADGRAMTPCPVCGHALPEKGISANLMMKTTLGPVEETGEKVYLRPETAQGIFVNFPNVLDATHRRLPFGIAQIGKSFRNEITPGNFTFRTREFEQMEIEYFTHPKDADKFYKKWIEQRHQWYLDLGMQKENLRLREHGAEELAHYAKGCTDIEYQFPFGWSELEGIANRADFDLKQHEQFSGKNLKYKDNLTQEEFFPYIIEPSGGCDRATLAFLVDAYREEEVAGSLDKDSKTRVVLKLSKELAPIKVAVLPLLKKNDKIVELAKKIKENLQKSFVSVYDDTAAIGKLYRRQDEGGTFFCVTVDVQSLEDHQVTVRERDTMKQERISVPQLEKYLKEKFN